VDGVSESANGCWNFEGGDRSRFLGRNDDGVRRLVAGRRRVEVTGTVDVSGTSGEGGGGGGVIGTGID
jgi:hypothetical protein